jgi:hypothetical protein
MADSGGNEPSRASNALFKRQEQLQRWKQSETAQEPIVKPTKRNKLKFDDGTVFLSAVSAADLDEVRKLLQKGSDVNYQNVDGVTALHQVGALENIAGSVFLLYLIVQWLYVREKCSQTIRVCDDKLPWPTEYICIIVKDCLLENGFMVALQRRFFAGMMDIYVENSPSRDMDNLGRFCGQYMSEFYTI